MLVRDIGAGEGEREFIARARQVPAGWAERDIQKWSQPGSQTGLTTLRNPHDNGTPPRVEGDVTSMLGLDDAESCCTIANVLWWQRAALESSVRSQENRDGMSVWLQLTIKRSTTRSFRTVPTAIGRARSRG